MQTNLRHVPADAPLRLHQLLAFKVGKIVRLATVLFAFTIAFAGCESMLGDYSWQPGTYRGGSEPDNASYLDLKADHSFVQFERTSGLDAGFARTYNAVVANGLWHMDGHNLVLKPAAVYKPSAFVHELRVFRRAGGVELISLVGGSTPGLIYSRVSEAAAARAHQGFTGKRPEPNGSTSS